MIDAQCNCGALALSLPGLSSLVVAYHCVDCQRRTGAPFGVGAFYPAEGVTISGTPKEYVRTAASGGQVRSYFCPGCGFDGLLEGGQSACDDRRCRWRDSRPGFPGSDQVGFRTVETCVG
jgi:hypothetical protein